MLGLVAPSFTITTPPLPRIRDGELAAHPFPPSLPLRSHSPILHRLRRALPKRRAPLLLPKASVGRAEYVAEPATNVNFPKQMNVVGCSTPLVLLGTGTMAFSIILVLMVLMATSGVRGRGCGKKQVSKRTLVGENTSDLDSEYVSEEPTDKGKGKAPETSTQISSARSPPHRSTGGPVITEPNSTVYERCIKRGEELEPVSSKRHKAYASKACHAERYVNFSELTCEVPDFSQLLQRAPIEPVGCIPARAPFCVELIREFYMHGKVTHEDSETGSYQFETVVRGKRVVVTPQTIGDIFGLSVSITGLPYTQGAFQISTHWNTVTNAICKPGTYTNRLVVESRELKPEYHILSLIVCYNIVPTVGTKRIRWERLVLLYLLGHPDHAQGLNINISFLMWQRMTNVIHVSGARELLPFPILITRILERNGVDIDCDK